MRVRGEERMPAENSVTHPRRTEYRRPKQNQAGQAKKRMTRPGSVCRVSHADEEKECPKRETEGERDDKQKTVMPR